MPDDHDSTAATASTAGEQRREQPRSRAQPGPELLEERTLAGIFVHLLGVATLFALPTALYLASDHEFTRANARNAANWQAFYVGSIAALFASLFVLDAVASLPFPNWLASRLDVGGSVLGGWTLAFTLVLLANLALPVVATAKAVFGDAWRYPLAPDVVGAVASRTDDGSRVWLLLATYAVGVPVTAASLLATALGEGSFYVTFLLLLWLLFGVVYSAAAIVRDARQLADADAAWQPNWPAYLAPAAVAGVATSLAAEPLWSSGNPSGDATFAGALVLWVATLAYLYRRHDRIGTP